MALLGTGLGGMGVGPGVSYPNRTLTGVTDDGSGQYTWEFSGTITVVSSNPADFASMQIDIDSPDSIVTVGAGSISLHYPGIGYSGWTCLTQPAGIANVITNLPATGGL